MDQQWSIFNITPLELARMEFNPMTVLWTLPHDVTLWEEEEGRKKKNSCSCQYVSLMNGKWKSDFFLKNHKVITAKIGSLYFDDQISGHWPINVTLK